MTVLITYTLFCRRNSTLLQVDRYNTQHSCHLGTDYCLWISVCLQTAVGARGSCLGWEKVTFICSVKTFSGLAEQGCSTVLLFPHVEQDSTGCLPKDQLNTNLEDPDPLLPKQTSSITARGRCRSYFQTKVRYIPSSKDNDKSLFLKVLLLQQSRGIHSPSTCCTSLREVPSKPSHF